MTGLPPQAREYWGQGELKIGASRKAGPVPAPGKTSAAHSSNSRRLKPVSFAFAAALYFIIWRITLFAILPFGAHI
ncbi:MAG: hypothetical protein R3D01_14070 [Hyphomicrobiales bacterium]